MIFILFILMNKTIHINLNSIRHPSITSLYYEKKILLLLLIFTLCDLLLAQVFPVSLVPGTSGEIENPIFFDLDLFKEILSNHLVSAVLEELQGEFR